MIRVLGTGSKEGGVLRLLRSMARLAETEGARVSARLLAKSVLPGMGMARWLAFLETFVDDQRLPTAPTTVLRKPLDRYFALGLGTDRRVALLVDHYRIAADMLPHAFVAALWTTGVLPLSEIAGKKARYALRLLRSDLAATREEGEWTLLLECLETDLALCRLTFLLVRVEGGPPTVAIGGVQGAASAEAKTRVIFATRDLGGLRPKDALLLTAAGIAAGLGAEVMQAVGNAGQLINARGLKRRAKLVSNYDAYWEERGGSPGGPYDFLLPVKNPAYAEPGQKRRDEAKKAFWDAGAGLVIDRRKAAA